MQLIIASSLVARRRKSGTVDVPDVRRVYALFIDESAYGGLHRSQLTAAERSVEWCRQQESTFVTESTWWGEANGSSAPMDIAA